MITETINKALIEAMREKVPEGINLAGLLMNTLYIGKEAVYRRLRSEVPFTLAEAATISRKLGVSLDKLLGSVYKESALCSLNLASREDPGQTYCSILENYVKIFRGVREVSDGELSISSNTVPQTFYLKYDALSRFRLFKWMYQHGNVDLAMSFDELELPEKLPQRRKEFVDAAKQVPMSCHILDKMVFRHWVDDIRYFAGIRLLGDEGVQLLKEELFELLDEMESVAGAGRFANGSKVQLFISNIDFEATYGYIEAGALRVALIQLYSIDSITSKDPELFGNFKAWILSLRKFSTLISESGDMQRALFFKRQREIVGEL